MKRMFSIVAACIVAFLVLFGCQTNSSGSRANLTSADVVVVGGGIAGVTAAISARESGAKVILVEKRAVVGGSSGISGGGIGAAGSRVQARNNIQDSPATWRTLWTERQNLSLNTSNGFPKWDYVDWFINQGSDLIDWVESQFPQGTVYPSPGTYGRDTVSRLHFPPIYPIPEGNPLNSGPALLKYLEDSARAKGVHILTNTKAVGLVQDAAGARVTGVKLASGDVITAKAVVLAAGGFGGSFSAANPTHGVAEFIPELASIDIRTSGVLDSFGEGIMMGVAAGGELWENPWVIGMAVSGAYIGVNFMDPEYQWIFVDSTGSRVMNENQHYALITNDAIKTYLDNKKLFAIFDSSVTPTDTQLAQPGVVRGAGATADAALDDLASKAGINAAGLKAQINAYNAIVDSKNDTAFGKDFSIFTAQVPAKKIVTAPFYAVQVFPNIMGTFGGVKTNLNCEVLAKSTGNAIPGLYAAGENANRPFVNQVYMSGGGTGTAAAMGRTAGKNAAQFSQR